MEPNIENKIAELDAKLSAIYESVEKTRKYLLWTGIITAAVIVLPLIAMAFVLPSFINNYVNTLQSLEF